MTRLVDIEETSLLEQRIGALPIVNAYVHRLGLAELLDSYVPMDPRATVAPSTSLLVLLTTLVIERAPVYKITEWAADRPPGLLGLLPGEAKALNDDRIGTRCSRPTGPRYSRGS